MCKRDALYFRGFKPWVEWIHHTCCFDFHIAGQRGLEHPIRGPYFKHIILRSTDLKTEMEEKEKLNSDTKSFDSFQRARPPMAVVSEKLIGSHMSSIRISSLENFIFFRFPIVRHSSSWLHALITKVDFTHWLAIKLNKVNGTRRIMNYTNLYIMETFCQLYTSIFGIVGRILLDHFDVAGYPKFSRIVKAHQLECTNCIINSPQLLLHVIQRMKDESIINLVISARPHGMAIGRTSFPDWHSLSFHF